MTAFALQTFEASAPSSPEENSGPVSGEFPIFRRTERVEEGPADDATLVERVLGGSERAATEIWTRYSGLVRAMLRRSIGRDDVDDSVQEVFIRLFPALPQLRQASSLRSFLIGITLRVAGTDLRRRKCRGWLQLTPTGELADVPVMPDHADDAYEALARFQVILDKLSEDARLIFVLRYVEGMDVAEVAAALEISLATAKRHLSRAAARVFAMVERDPALVSYVTMRSSSGSEEIPSTRSDARAPREARA